MDWTLFNLNTFIPETPQIINNNFASFKRYLDVFYSETSGIIISPVNTTGRVKAATGEFVNVVVDNLTVKKQYTNLLSNNTTADLDYYNTYWGLDASYRINSSTAWYSTTSNVWDSSCFRYIDVISPYCKIKNDASYAFNTETLGQVVEVLFDVSTTLTTSPFNIRLDGSTKGHSITIASKDASGTWVQLICIADDPSLGNTWIVKQYAGTITKTTW
jgi:hypothetical protein